VNVVAFVFVLPKILISLQQWEKRISGSHSRTSIKVTDGQSTAREKVGSGQHVSTIQFINLTFRNISIAQLKVVIEEERELETCTEVSSVIHVFTAFTYHT
jgi:hypothetical protein